jgi:hypothetical protein
VNADKKMNISKKNVILSISIFCLLFTVYCLTTQAAKPTEISYPEINAIRPVTIKTALPEYAKYVFDFLVAVSGLICLGTMIYGGIEYLTSTGDPGKQKSATSRIWSSFLGAALILISFIISQTINPQLIIPHAHISATGGLVLGTESCNGNEPGGETKVIFQDTPNFGETGEGNEFIAKSLKFASRPGDLRAILFHGSDYNDAGKSLLKVSSDFQDCLNLDGFGIEDARSAKLYWQLPGVYLCTGHYETDASGELACNEEEKHLSTSTALLDPDFNDQVHSLRFRPAYITERWANDFASCDARFGKLWEENGQYYCTYAIKVFGVVLHEHADFTGKCEVFQGREYETTVDLLNDSETIKPDEASSVTMLIENIDSGTLSGGVWLCEDVNPQRPYPTNGSVENPTKCHGRDDANPLLGFQSVVVEFSEDPDGNVPNDKISSIIIDGEYSAVLFEHRDFKGKCQVFTDSDSNFRDDPIGRCNCVMGNWQCQDCLSSFIILPTTE